MTQSTHSVSDDEEKHRRRMRRKKSIVDDKIARADNDKGVLLVLTGAGKGKSSSGFGMVARALGHDMRVGVVQFIKGTYSTGEEAFFRRFPEVDYHVAGEGFTWETQDRDRDIKAAHAGWEQAHALLRSSSVDFVLLDELNIVLKKRYLMLDDVITALELRPPMQHVVITGRNAPPALLDLADTVTDMRMIKHAFKAGIRAQKGIEL